MLLMIPPPDCPSRRPRPPAAHPATRPRGAGRPHHDRVARRQIPRTPDARSSAPRHQPARHRLDHRLEGGDDPARQSGDRGAVRIRRRAALRASGRVAARDRPARRRGSLCRRARRAARAHRLPPLFGRSGLAAVLPGHGAAPRRSHRARHALHVPPGLHDRRPGRSLLADLLQRLARAEPDGKLSGYTARRLPEDCARPVRRRDRAARGRGAANPGAGLCVGRGLRTTLAEADRPPHWHRRRRPAAVDR